MCICHLIVLTPGENNSFTADKRTTKGNIGAYISTRDELITMSNKIKNNKYCTLPFDTIRNTRELKLNKHPARKHSNRYQLKPKANIKPNSNTSDQKKK